MPIPYTTLHGTRHSCYAFMPEEVKVLGDAFNDTMKALHVDKRDELIGRLIARQIVELAKRGERDRNRLRLKTLASLKMEPRRLRIAS